MDYKKVKTDLEAITRDTRKFSEQTSNIYETAVIISKRSNQIALEIKDELGKKIEEFTTTNDNLEEVFENKEQIEIARFYERLPKPTLIAVNEYLNDQIYYRNPHREVKRKKAN
ncbi:MAG TPA: DNA-directed RNA polymerase subunit omega [Bacteroidales bacterium]|jgi:DNA-directed RNA polymerase subunit K/omega|nr:DNA-directed RNA polymerase subunit omega [Bacteroidales bacterium]MDX9907796.1 DNA-directed RNA polymerase subunit omega [Bacteroidales bacterium]HOX77775.1 DNA-directed RNA polymerase subunit omega [Bacteroidales bacterium]HPM93387.1 DNA-directed RNA polymerase subunit omega [Bacteroidales bacterium]